MSTHDVMTHAYEEQIDAELEQANAQLAEFEARAKGKKAKAEINTINLLRTKHREIEKKRQDLKTIGEAKVEHSKAEIETEIAKLKTSLAELATKLKI